MAYAVRKNWNARTDRDDNNAKELLLGMVMNGLDWVNGRVEFPEDYIIRFRMKGGGIFFALWHEMQGDMKFARIEIGSPALKCITWKCSMKEGVTKSTSDVIFWWCPRDGAMPIHYSPASKWWRDWYLYEFLYAYFRFNKWNEESSLGAGRPACSTGKNKHRSEAVERLLRIKD